MTRRYSASDVRRYARCPRQWWYETRRDSLAALDATELERRMALLRRRFGNERARALPVYTLLADLAARQDDLARGRHAHTAHSRLVARRASGCLPSVALLLLVLVACVHAAGSSTFKANRK